MIDICTTATLRPGIFEKAFTSYRERLLQGHPARLVVNIDAIGEAGARPIDVVALANGWFPDCVCRISTRPHRMRALLWTWDQVAAEFFLNLEDDWVIIPQLDVRDMLAAMKKHPRLAVLRLPKGAARNGRVMPYKPCQEPHFVWNGMYYEHPTGNDAVNYSGVPSLIRTAWMREFRKYLNHRTHHEVQAQRLTRKRFPVIRDWKFGVYTVNGDLRRTIGDIGIPWRRQHGFKRNAQNFTHWEKVPGHRSGK